MRSRFSRIPTRQWAVAVLGLVMVILTIGYAVSVQPDSPAFGWSLVALSLISFIVAIFSLAAAFREIARRGDRPGLLHE